MAAHVQPERQLSGDEWLAHEEVSASPLKADLSSKLIEAILNTRTANGKPVFYWGGLDRTQKRPALFQIHPDIEPMDLFLYLGDLTDKVATPVESPNGNWLRLDAYLCLIRCFTPLVRPMHPCLAFRRVPRRSAAWRARLLLANSRSFVPSAPLPPLHLPAGEEQGATQFPSANLFAVAESKPLLSKPKFVLCSAPVYPQHSQLLVFGTASLSKRSNPTVASPLVPSCALPSLTKKPTTLPPHPCRPNDLHCMCLFCDGFNMEHRLTVCLARNVVRLPMPSFNKFVDACDGDSLDSAVRTFPGYPVEAFDVIDCGVGYSGVAILSSEVLDSYASKQGLSCPTIEFLRSSFLADVSGQDGARGFQCKQPDAADSFLKAGRFLMTGSGDHSKDTLDQLFLALKAVTEQPALHPKRPLLVQADMYGLYLHLWNLWDAIGAETTLRRTHQAVADNPFHRGELKWRSGSDWRAKKFQARKGGTPVQLSPNFSAKAFSTR